MSAAYLKDFVSIIIPALNEEQFIRAAVESVRPDCGELDYEILVADGGSTDATRSIVLAMSAADSKIKLVENEKRYQSAGVNKAASLVDPRSSVILRADAHAVYPHGFVRRCVEELRRRSAKSLVVAMRTAGTACLQSAIAATQNSLIGNGGSIHRHAANAQSGYVEHGHHAAFDLAAFRSVGGYDETFTHNEDAEFDVRFREAGHSIWFAADLVVTYFPRPTVGKLARQYFNHGRGRGRTTFKHHIVPKPRQVFPLAALAVTVLGLVALPFSGLLEAPLLAYLCVTLGWGLLRAARDRDACLLLMGPAAVIMHLAWAVGFLVAVWEAATGRTEGP